MEFNSDTGLKVLIYINAGTLASIIIFGYKIVKFFNHIEFKTDLMWEDYQIRLKIREEDQ